MRRRGLAAAAAAMMLPACSAAPPANEPAAPSITSYFTCSTGEKIVVVYSEDRAMLYDPAGRGIALRQTTAGSGALYRGGGHELREKGTSLIWTAPRHKPRTCTSKVSVPASTNP